MKDYAPLILILIGAGVIVVGVTGSAKNVCKAITGNADGCKWIPGYTSTEGETKKGNTSNNSIVLPGAGLTGIDSHNSSTLPHPGAA